MSTDAEMLEAIIKKADAILVETAERLEAAGVPPEQIPHALIGSGLVMLECDVCLACLVDELMDVRKEIDAKIAEARKVSQGKHVH